MGHVLLDVRDVESFYEKSQALFGMSFSVREGEFCTLIGRNGMGKTTTIKSVMGLLQPAAGRILFEGQPLERLPPYRVARFGLGLVPEGRQIFTNLTVQENLAATARGAKRPGDAWTLERIYALFPSLARRSRHLGCNLSGGEQQMLATARTILGQPSILLLDEPLEGLAPVICDMLMAAFAQLASSGAMTILFVEQRLESALDFAEEVIILERGRIVWSGTSSALRADGDVLERYVGVGGLH